MANAKQPGGLYYDSVRKQMVDAEGKVVEGADKPGPDTPPGQQLGALGSTLTPEERMATAIASALNTGAGATAGPLASGSTAPVRKGKK